MVNWTDPARIAEDAAIFSKLMLVCIGIIGWEIIVTFPYDWTILSGKRKFKYPMGFYFACRYSLFFSLIGINIALNSTTKLNCQALYVFNQLMGNIAIATASTLLMLRTIAIWSRNIMVVVPLVILALGQWGILLHGVITVHAVYSDVARSCVVTDTLPIFLDLIYVYSELSTWANRDVYLPTHNEGQGPRPALTMGNPRGSGTNTSEAAFAGKNSRLGVTKSLNDGVHISMEAYTTTDNRDLPEGKEYESDVDETGSESENGNGAVRYTRSERAQVKLPEAPRVGFTQDLTTKNQNATDEKR
ncbi:hypothetical protein FS837_009332 [Tulasnella sp. UAMH 9824]|nr:hypothetical protein FS837_009332 [Tulasnella sp. UAMH 9824]